MILASSYLLGFGILFLEMNLEFKSNDPWNSSIQIEFKSNSNRIQIQELNLEILKYFEIGPLEALFLTALPTQLLNNELHCLTVHLPCKMQGKLPCLFWNPGISDSWNPGIPGPEILEFQVLKSWNNLETGPEILKYLENKQGFWPFIFGVIFQYDFRAICTV